MISPQSPRDQIADYQRTLQLAGYYLGAIDGLWGPRTQRAHEAYLAAQLPAAPSDNSSLETVRKGILETAEHFLNLTETAPNSRWADLIDANPAQTGEELRQKLLETGWQLGWPYCAAFAEVCWRAGYKLRPELSLISRSITPSAMGTYENFDQLSRITKAPLPGALMLMQHGQTSQGHVGIVTGLSGGTLYTIEGNTSSMVAIPTAASDREGDGVYRKQKPLDFTPRAQGLWIRGFVNPFLI